MVENCCCLGRRAHVLGNDGRFPRKAFASIPENVSTIFVFAVSASLLAAVMAGRRPRQAGVLAVVLLLLLFQLIAATVYFFAVSSGGV
jgi:asparagine N-glycosylation enzyme membrane subunit Stt3